MALAMLRAPPPDLEVRLDETQVSPTALYGGHPMYERYRSWIEAHLKTVDFGHTEVLSEESFTVIAPYCIQLDCSHRDDYVFSEDVQLAMCVLYDGGRETIEGKVSIPWGYSFCELYPAIAAGLLASSRFIQDAFVQAEAFGDTDAARAIAESIFVIDCEVLRGQPVALQAW